MAKRSPILGYNHNVRYRGLVFHVQTEDSGVLAPHLFTHLFHSGVIVSTRKYVYDAGSTEEAIKALMQAQHKAVLKDLKRGQFDDKIDLYLGGTPGLTARGSADEAADPAEPERSAKPPGGRASSAGIGTLETLRDASAGAEDEPVESTVVGGEPAISREMTLEEPALPLRPTELAVVPPQLARAAAPQVQAAPPARPARPQAVIVDDFETTRTEAPGDSQSEITIQLEADEPDAAPGGRRRHPNDTETSPWDQTRLDLSNPLSDGVPGLLSGAVTIRTLGDATGSVPGASGPITSPLSQRAVKAVGAASLPPARPIARPPTRPAVVPPPQVSRPMPAEDRRQSTVEPIDAFAPTQATELPVEAPERPGQYSQHKKISSRIPSDTAPEALRPQGAIPPIARPGSPPQIPPPARPSTIPQPPQQPRTGAAPRASTPPPPVPAVPPVQRATPPPMPVPPVQRATPPPMPVPSRTATPTPPAAQPVRPVPAVPPQRQTPFPVPAVRAPGEPRPRTPTPPRVSMTSSPSVGGAGQPAGRAGTPSAGSPVVMTRPAVIVGGPAKPATSSQRVRKAREDEGHSFGQGLISEKSLDEVILAYLSEDAEDK